MTWPFAPLRMFGYEVILADPPWLFQLRSEDGEEKSPQAHYDCMPTEEIAALPVGHLASRDCLLFMWATWPMLPDALQVMRAWGFAYRTGGAWLKKTRHGKNHMGTGYILRSATEPFLIGVIGNPRMSGAQRAIRNVIEAAVREHSRKPDEQYEILERLFPRAWRCELFARSMRPGWDSWGREVGKFSAARAGAPVSMQVTP